MRTLQLPSSTFTGEGICLDYLQIPADGHRYFDHHRFPVLIASRLYWLLVPHNPAFSYYRFISHQATQNSHISYRFSCRCGGSHVSTHILWNRAEFSFLHNSRHTWRPCPSPDHSPGDVIPFRLAPDGRCILVRVRKNSVTEPPIMFHNL